MNEKPLVTVIVPSYNHAKYIEHCLKSIVSQSYDNIELIIIDDYSVDNSFDILSEWVPRLKKCFKRVILLKNDKNLGITRTLNRAVKEARGKYIKLIASDDLILCNGIEKLVDYYEMNQECDVIFSNVYLGDEKTLFIKSNNYELPLFYEKKLNTGKITFKRLFKENYIVAVGVMFLKDTFLKYGLFDEDIGIEDWEYWLRVSRTGIIRYADIVATVYRINNSSITHYQNSNDGEKKFIYMMLNEVKIIEKYKKQAGIYGDIKLIKYCFWRLIKSNKLKYRDAAKIISDYMKKNNGILLKLLGLTLSLFYKY